MDREIDIVIERLISTLARNVDSSSVGALVNPDSYPTLVGIPLEILSRNEGKVVLTSGNANLPDADRIDADIKDVEFFYSNEAIAAAFQESIQIFLDRYLVRKYAGDDYDDPDFEEAPYEDF